MWIKKILLIYGIKGGDAIDKWLGIELRRSGKYATLWKYPFITSYYLIDLLKSLTNLRTRVS